MGKFLVASEWCATVWAIYTQRVGSSGTSQANGILSPDGRTVLEQLRGTVGTSKSSYSYRQSTCHTCHTSRRHRKDTSDQMRKNLPETIIICSDCKLSVFETQLAQCFRSVLLIEEEASCRDGKA